MLVTAGDGEEIVYFYLLGLLVITYILVKTEYGFKVSWHENRGVPLNQFTATCGSCIKLSF